MSTEATLQIVSTSLETTESIGETIGLRLQGGEFIELASDLGGGKTALSRGIVRGTGSGDHVASPTFTVSRVYQAERFSIHHFDLYRLQEAGLMQHELGELIDDPTAVIITEWGEAVSNVQPKIRLRIEISKTGEQQRAIDLYYDEPAEYLLEGLC